MGQKVIMSRLQNTRAALGEHNFLLLCHAACFVPGRLGGTDSKQMVTLTQFSPSVCQLGNKQISSSVIPSLSFALKIAVASSVIPTRQIRELFRAKPQLFANSRGRVKFFSSVVSQMTLIASEHARARKKYNF